MMLSRSRFVAISFLAPALVAACGGGGGGGGVPSTPTPISPANATEVARAMPVALEMVEFEEVLGFENMTSDGTGTFACPAGGSVTAQFDVDQPPIGEVSTGDRFSVSFSSCMLDSSSRLNGSLVYDFNVIVGNYLVDDMWEVDIDLAINNLTFSSGPASGFFDGNWSQNSTYNMGDSTFALDGTFTVAANDGSGLEIAVLSGLELDCDYDSVAAESTYSVGGTFASTELNGSITMETLSPVVMADGALYPHTGTLRATGDGGSALTFTILDDTFVQLEVDEDGDGNFEYLVTTTWDELSE